VEDAIGVELPDDGSSDGPEVARAEVCIVASDLRGPDLPGMRYFNKRRSKDGGMRHDANHNGVRAKTGRLRDGNEGDVWATTFPIAFKREDEDAVEACASSKVLDLVSQRLDGVAEEGRRGRAADWSETFREIGLHCVPADTKGSFCCVEKYQRSR
jgi:hypothetical protein